MKQILYTDLELPRAAVQRIIKNSTDGRLVQKDAKLACAKAATVFVSAQDYATAANQKTISANHILQAVEALGFGQEFNDKLVESLEAFKKQATLAKEAKKDRASSATAAAQPIDATAPPTVEDSEDAIIDEI